MRKSVFISVLLVSGCVSTSGIVPYGKDTYNLTNKNYGNYAALRGDTLRKANEYCSGLGKSFQPQREEKSSIDGGFAPVWTYELTFRCLSEDDPEFVRPVMQSDPDVIIKQ